MANERNTKKGSYTLGLLILTILTYSIVVTLPGQLQLSINPTNSEFFVYENGSLVLSGVEYSKLMDGTKNMRAKSRSVTNYSDGDDIVIVRTSVFKEGEYEYDNSILEYFASYLDKFFNDNDETKNIIMMDVYRFNTQTSDITMFPISHEIRVLNGEGLILLYEVQKLLYTGDTIKDIESPQKFGHQMEIEWDVGNYYSKIYKYTGKDEGKLQVKYRINDTVFEKQVRLFDPPGSDLIVTGTISLGGNLTYDNINITSTGVINVNGTGYLNLTGIQSIIIDGTINAVSVGGSGGSGGDGCSNGNGQGDGPGSTGTCTTGSNNYAGGGGGGGAYSNGGTGGTPGGSGGSDYMSTSTQLYIGSGAGAGGAVNSGVAESSGSGGSGGGGVKIRAPIIIMSGNLYAYGGNGGNGDNEGVFGASGGGGGGSGGSIIIVGQHVSLSGNLYAYGGNGGNGDADGSDFCAAGAGGGSGGRIDILYLELNDTSTKQYSGGSGGSGTGSSCTIYNGASGGTGITTSVLTNDFDILLERPELNELVSTPTNITCSSASNSIITLKVDSLPINTSTGTISINSILSDGVHNYTCNTSSESTYISEFTVKSSIPTVNSLTPLDNFISDNNTNTFSINITDDQVGLGIVNLYTDEDGTFSLRQTNTSAIGTNTSEISFIRTTNVNNFIWSIEYCDNISNCAFTDNRTIYLDIFSPIIVITYPENISYITNVSQVNFTLQDEYPSKCWFSKDLGDTNSTPVSMTNGDNSFNITSILLDNAITIYCNDTRNNIGSDVVYYYMAPIEYSVLDNGTQADVSGLGPIKVAAKLSPVLDIKNLTTRIYNLTDGELIEYKNFSFPLGSYPSIVTYSYAFTSIADPVYWDFIVCENDDTCYELPKRYRGIEEINLTLNGGTDNLTAELGANITIDAISNIYNVSLDIDHPQYDANYSSGFLETSLDIIIDFFRRNIFSDGNYSQNLTFPVDENYTYQNVSFDANKYDYVEGLSFNISGNTDEYGAVVVNQLSDLSFEKIYPGSLFGSFIKVIKSWSQQHCPTVGNCTFTRTNNTLSYDNEGTQLLQYYMDDNSTFNYFTLEITGQEYGFSFTESFNSYDYIDTEITSAIVKTGGLVPFINEFVNETRDYFNDSSINTTLWGYSNDGDYSCTDSDCFDYQTSTSESAGKILSLQHIDEDFDAGNTSSERLNSAFSINQNATNLMAVENMSVSFQYSIDGSTRNNEDHCEAEITLEYGSTTLFEDSIPECSDDDLDCNSVITGDLTIKTDASASDLLQYTIYGSTTVAYRTGGDYCVGDGIICRYSTTYGEAVSYEDGLCVYAVSGGVYAYWQPVSCSYYSGTTENTCEDGPSGSWFVSGSCDYVSGGCGNINIVNNYTNNSRTVDTQDCGDSTIELGNFFVTSVNNLGTSVLNFEQETDLDFEETAGGTRIGCEEANNNLYIEPINFTFRSLENSTASSLSVFDSAASISTLTSTFSGDFSTLEQSGMFGVSTDNGENYQEVISGQLTPIINPGEHVKWRLFFNILNNSVYTAPYFDTIAMSTPTGFPSNITFDFGNDGIIDAEFEGELNETNSPQTIIISNPNVSGSFTGTPDIGTSTYLVPLVVGSDSIGIIYLDNYNFTYNPNPVSFNSTLIETKVYELSDNESGEVNITIGSTGGNITIDDLRYDYAGGNSTVEIIAHNLDYTVQVALQVLYYFSRWDYNFVPLYVDFIDFYPIYPSSKDVEPYGQASSQNVSILNVTNYGYGGKNATLSVIHSTDTSCIDTFISTNATKQEGLINEPTYTNESYSVSGNLTLPVGLASDGSYLWTMDTIADDVYKYYINGTYTGESFDIAGYGITSGFGIETNGTYFWITDAGDDSVYKLWLNGTSTGENFSSIGGVPLGLTQNGTNIWVVDITSVVYKFTMNGTYTGENFTLDSANDDPYAITQNGDRFLVSDSTDDVLYEYTMDGTYSNNTYPASEAQRAGGLVETGDYMYLLGRTNDAIYKYSLIGEKKIEDDTWTIIKESMGYLETVDVYMWKDYDCSYSAYNVEDFLVNFRLCVEDGLCSDDIAW